MPSVAFLLHSSTGCLLSTCSVLEIVSEAGAPKETKRAREFFPHTCHRHCQRQEVLRKSGVWWLLSPSTGHFGSPRMCKSDGWSSLFKQLQQDSLLILKGRSKSTHAQESCCWFNLVRRSHEPVLCTMDTTETAVASATLKFRTTRPLALGDLGHNAPFPGVFVP